MGKYELEIKAKLALDKLGKSLLNFAKEFPIKEIPEECPEEYKELYGSAYKYSMDWWSKDYLDEKEE